MAKIIGIAESNFVGDGGKQIEGYNVYLTSPLTRGSGLFAERVYLTKARMEALTFVPSVGDEVEVAYNKKGKCVGMTLVG